MVEWCRQFGFINALLMKVVMESKQTWYQKVATAVALAYGYLICIIIGLVALLAVCGVFVQVFKWFLGITNG